MSDIALKHGGTIDKFVGDAILIFFGDPESKGEAEDARACLRMAAAMQQRLAELHVKWRKAGVEALPKSGHSASARFMSTRPSTTLADFYRGGIPKSVFL
jgi:translation initiation factor RLI1